VNESNVGTCGKMDAFVSKFSEDLTKSIMGKDETSTKFMNDFQILFDKYPSMVLIDDLASQSKLLSRETMSEVFSCIEMESKGLVNCPSSVLINENDNIPENISFPCICKSIEAGGTETSHQMGILFNSSALNDWPRPFIIQQYINHDCTIDKLFVVGNKSFVDRRSSLNNYDADENRPPLLFNSQNMKEVLGNYQDFNVPVIPQDMLDNITNVIIKETNLHLMGIDIIRDNKTGKLYIIDINYFPGYKGVDNFCGILLDYIVETINLHSKNFIHLPLSKKKKLNTRIKIWGLPWKTNRVYIDDICSRFGMIKNIEMKKREQWDGCICYFFKTK